MPRLAAAVLVALLSVGCASGDGESADTTTTIGGPPVCQLLGELKERLQGNTALGAEPAPAELHTYMDGVRAFLDQAVEKATPSMKDTLLEVQQAFTEVDRVLDRYGYDNELVRKKGTPAEIDTLTNNRLREVGYELDALVVEECDPS